MHIEVPLLRFGHIIIIVTKTYSENGNAMKACKSGMETSSVGWYCTKRDTQYFICMIWCGEYESLKSWPGHVYLASGGVLLCSNL